MKFLRMCFGKTSAFLTNGVKKSAFLSNKNLPILTANPDVHDLLPSKALTLKFLPFFSELSIPSSVKMVPTDSQEVAQLVGVALLL